MNLGSLGSLFIDLAANTANFETDLGHAAKLAEKRSKEIQEGFERAAEKIFVAFESFEISKRFVESIGEAAKQMDELGKAAQKTGVGVERLSELKYAASLADVQFDALTGGLIKFNKATIEGANGGKEQLAAFKAVGISLADLKKLSPDQLFIRTADAFAKTRDDAAKTSVSLVLLGKSGADLIPLMNGGGKSLAEAAAEAHKLGVAVDKEAAEAAERFNDNFTKLKAAGQGFAYSVARDVIPEITRFQEKLLDPENLKAAKDLAEGVIHAGEAVVQFMVNVAGATRYLSESLAAFNGGANDLVRIDDSLKNYAERIATLKAAAEGGAGAFAKLKLSMGEAEISQVDRNKTGAAYTIEHELDLLQKEQVALQMRKKLLAQDAVLPPALPAAAKPADDKPKDGLPFHPKALEDADRAAKEQQEALKKIMDVAAKQEADLVKSAEAAKGNKFSGADVLGARFAPSGDLADDWAKAGHAADQYIAAAMKAAARQDDVNAAAARFAEQQRKAIEQGQELERQVNALNQHDAFAAIGKAASSRTGPMNMFGPAVGAIGNATDNARKEEQQRYKKQLADYDSYLKSKAILDEEYQKRTKQASALHEDNLARINEAGGQAQLEENQKNFGIMINFQEDFFSQMAQKSKAYFEIEKQISVIRTIINTAEASMAAFKWAASWGGPIAGAAAAAVTAGMGAIEVAAIESESFPARRYGGPVYAGGVYEVAEPGNPEMLRYGNRQFLMTPHGGGDGYVMPLKAMQGMGSSGGNINIHNYSGLGVQATRRSDGDTDIFIGKAMQGAVNAARSAVASDIKNPTSQTSRSLKATHGTKPRALV